MNKVPSFNHSVFIFLRTTKFFHVIFYIYFLFFFFPHFNPAILCKTAKPGSLRRFELERKKKIQTILCSRRNKLTTSSKMKIKSIRIAKVNGSFFFLFSTHKRWKTFTLSEARCTRSRSVRLYEYKASIIRLRGGARGD